MTDISWINPFSNKEQKIVIQENLINADGTLKVPIILNNHLEDFYSLAIEGCLESAHEGNSESMRHLMYFLLRLLKDDGKTSVRKFDFLSIKKALYKDQRSFNDYFKNMHLGIKSIDLNNDPYFQFCQQVANTFFDPTHSKGLPKRHQLQLTPNEFDIIYNKITKAYSETHGAAKEDKAQLRNFRSRLKSKESIGDKFEILRNEATIYESYFHHKVASRFLEATNRAKLYTELNSDFFSFLHLEREIPQQLKSPLKFIPPLASLQIYPLISNTYESVFKTPLEVSIKHSIYKKRNGDISDFEILHLNIAGIINWYMSDYLNLVRSEKTNKIKISSNPNSKDTEKIREIKRLKAIESLGLKLLSREDFRKRLNSLTEKQRTCFDLFVEGKSLEGISTELEISKDSVRDRLKGATKKLKG